MLRVRDWAIAAGAPSPPCNPRWRTRLLVLPYLSAGPEEVAILGCGTCTLPFILRYSHLKRLAQGTVPGPRGPPGSHSQSIVGAFMGPSDNPPTP